MSEYRDADMRPKKIFRDKNHEELFYMFIINFFDEHVDEEALLSLSNPFDRTVQRILDLFPTEEYNNCCFKWDSGPPLVGGVKLKPLEHYER